MFTCLEVGVLLPNDSQTKTLAYMDTAIWFMINMAF